MSDDVEGQRISLVWALACMLASLAGAIAFNELVVSGHGKAIFLGLFVTLFITKTFQNSIRQSSVMTFLIGVAVFHVLLVFILPNDNQYPGGLLFPVGVVDIALFYWLFSVIPKRG